MTGTTDPLAAPARSAPRHATRLFVAGAVLMVAGFLLVAVPGAARHGMCAFVPCDPMTPTIGFALTPDGRTAIETGPQVATDIQEVALSSGSDPWDESEVIWRVERTGQVPADWSGQVVLGVVPEGFTETVPLTVPLAQAKAIGVGNVCYGSTADLPAGSLAVDAVTTGPEGPATPVDEFRASNYPFTPCVRDDDPVEQRWRRVGLVGLGLIAVGFVAFVVGGGLRQRAAPHPRSSHGAPGPLA